MTDDEILTIKDVAAYLKLNEKTAYRLVLDGKIPGFKVGGSWRFRGQDIRNWVDEQTEVKKNPNGKKG
jgi:excisionase family DNA binding protein